MYLSEQSVYNSEQSTYVYIESWCGLEKCVEIDLTFIEFNANVKESAQIKDKIIL